MRLGHAILGGMFTGVNAGRRGVGYREVVKLLSIAILTALGVALAADFPVVQPAELAAQLTGKGPRPAIFYVGPNVLYRSKHIPGSVYAGPGAKPEGLEAFKAAVSKTPRDRPLFVYCGCCPWDHCPNIRPVMALLKEMGFSHAKAMYMPLNFKADWIDKGYPVE
jgi:thiosulfate/3-mercaptopyruvate sulfurtransferase